MKDFNEAILGARDAATAERKTQIAAIANGEKPVAKICYWYDRTDRSWVVAAKDVENNQVGDADYSGDKKGRDFAIAMFKKDHNCTVVEKLKPTSL